MEVGILARTSCGTECRTPRVAVTVEPLSQYIYIHFHERAVLLSDQTSLPFRWKGVSKFRGSRPWRHRLDQWHTHPFTHFSAGQTRTIGRTERGGCPFANPCSLPAFCIAFDTTKRLQVAFPTRAPGSRSVPMGLTGRKWLEGRVGERCG